MEKPSLLEIIDHVGAWMVLCISTWQAPAESVDEKPEETAQKVINPKVRVTTEEIISRKGNVEEYLETETWEDS